MILTVTTVVFLRTILNYIYEHTSRARIMINTDTGIVIEGHDVFQVCTIVGSIPIQSTGEEIRPFIIDIAAFVACISRDTIYQIVVASDTTIRISSSGNDGVDIRCFPTDIVCYEGYLPNSHHEYTMLTSDFVNIAIYVCLGNGVFALQVTGTLLTFYTTNDYGSITIDKQLSDGKPLNIKHTGLVAKHLRPFLSIYPRSEYMRLLVAPTNTNTYALGISVYNNVYVWLHSAS